jgi:sugar/nucleoside kinase (ribokinase family)
MSIMADRAGIACAGNWIVDIVHTIDAWPRKSDLVHIRREVTGVGGGAANVALDLAALGAPFPVLPVGLIGQDLHGHLVRAALDRARLPATHIADTDAAPTAHTHVMTVPGDSRTFFYHPGCNDLLDEHHIPLDALAAAGIRIFYLGYLNLMGRMDELAPDGRSPAARVLERARALGMTTCVDLVSADTPAFRAIVAASLPHTDVLFLNEVEAARATGLPIASEDDRPGFAAAAAALRAGGARAVVIHSPALALWQDDRATWAPVTPVDPARIVSPVGAGDAFCAGALYGLHLGWPPDRCLMLAQRAATACLSGATATDGIPPASTLIEGA